MDGRKNRKNRRKICDYIAIILQDLPLPVAKVLNCVFFGPLIQII